MTTKDILAELERRGIKTAPVPASRLAEMKEDIARFRDTNELNGFQSWIVNERYVLDMPALSFEARTILCTARTRDLQYVTFTKNGKTVRDLMNGKEPEIDPVCEIVERAGYRLEPVHWLPQKRFASCSGLAQYGRNNITYIPGWGSLYELGTYVTDMPCPADTAWREAGYMDACDGCGKCRAACPTSVIFDDRFLINNELCLSNLLESGRPLPDWVKPGMVDSLLGCNHCQFVCPENQVVLAKIPLTLTFDEAETELLLAGIPFADMPEVTRAKVEQLEFEDWVLHTLARNLGCMLT